MSTDGRFILNYATKIHSHIKVNLAQNICKNRMWHIKEFMSSIPKKMWHIKPWAKFSFRGRVLAFTRFVYLCRRISSIMEYAKEMVKS